MKRAVQAHALAVALTTTCSALAEPRQGAFGPSVASTKAALVQQRTEALEQAQRRASLANVAAAKAHVYEAVGAPPNEADLLAQQANTELEQAKGALEESKKTDDASKAASPFSIGTMLGVAIPLTKQVAYKVRSGVVVREHSPEFWDYVQPGGYILPSLAVYTGTAGGTLSLIVPAGITAKGGDLKDASLGFGLAYGFTASRGAEIGLGLALVWNQTPGLSAAQENSYKQGTRLPDGESDTLPTRLRPSLLFGAYVTPTF